MNKEQKIEYVANKLMSFYFRNFESFSDYQKTSIKGASEICKEFFDYWLNRNNNFNEEIFNKAITIVPFYMKIYGGKPRSKDKGYRKNFLSTEHNNQHNII